MIIIKNFTSSIIFSKNCQECYSKFCVFLRIFSKKYYQNFIHIFSTFSLFLSTFSGMDCGPRRFVWFDDDDDDEDVDLGVEQRRKKKFVPEPKFLLSALEYRKTAEIIFFSAFISESETKMLNSPF